MSEVKNGRLTEETYEHHRIVVDKGQTSLRIDRFLVNRLINTSRSKIQQAAEAGTIWVNEKPVKSNYKVKANDVISIRLTFPPQEYDVVPEDIPIEILYEDDDVLIVHKDAGMVVHPAYGNYSGTLVNALAYHLRDNKMFAESEDERPGLVHRIDKDTSGLLVIAKSMDAKMHLSKQFFNHTVKRRYYALVWGNLKEDEGTISGHIDRSDKDRQVRTVFPDGSRGKHAVTHYKVLERLGYVNLVECRLETGRTHQIRVHFKYIGHPLFGDQTYGGDKILRGTTFTKYQQFVKNNFKLLPRQALHAKTLGFEHPATGEFIEFDSDIPQDMTAVIENWRKYVSNRDIDE